MSIGWQLLLMAIALTIVGWTRGKHVLTEYRAFQAWRVMQLAEPAPTPAQPTAAPSDPRTVLATLDPTPLAGAGRALAHPPADLHVALRYLQAMCPNGQYMMPLGWHVLPNGTIDCVTASLVDDIYHILITAQSRIGKDNLALNMLFALTHQYAPEQAQICVLDGKGLDWAGWKAKAHTWRLALDPDEIAPTMEALVAERKRRRTVLEAAGCENWEVYRGSDLPLLVIYVSELLLLESATSKSELTNWLNTELSASGAFGMRYIIATQTASNFSTLWRSQVSLYIAGYQPAPSQDAPNTGLQTKELQAIGAIPPSELPGVPVGRGVFTCVQGRNAFTIRTTPIDGAQRRLLLAAMPEKALQITRLARPINVALSKLQPSDDDTLTALLEGFTVPSRGEATSRPPSQGEGDTSRFQSPFTEETACEGAAEITLDMSIEAPVLEVGAAREVFPVDVPADEQQKILAVAKQSTKRSEVCQQLYNTTGGKRYTWVREVCDAAGLLM